MIEEIDRYLKDLFPIMRSITGSGNRKTLKLLQQIVPLSIIVLGCSFLSMKKDANACGTLIPPVLFLIGLDIYSSANSVNEFLISSFVQFGELIDTTVMTLIFSWIN